MAQLAEQLICNQQVNGSSPLIGSHGWLPEWPKGTDCKSAAICFGGSNPALPILFFLEKKFESKLSNPSVRKAPQGATPRGMAQEMHKNRKVLIIVAGWSSTVARRAHNPKVVGSNPAPAIFYFMPR